MKIVQPAQLPLHSIWCRAFGHNWHDQRIQGHGWGEKCGRCEAMRAEVSDS